MDKVTLNSKEQKRVIVINQVLAGQLTGQAAAELLGISLRQTRRLLAAYRVEGVASLAHGNRGRPPVNKLTRCWPMRSCVWPGMAIVTSTIVTSQRNWLNGIRSLCLSPPCGGCVGKPVWEARVSDERRGIDGGANATRKPGMLLQVDGSKHDWLEGRGPWLTLHAAIDDATNDVAWAVFREEEDATGYALLVHHISQTHGLPLALYADRHMIFQSPKHLSLEEQLAGLEPRTHLGQMLHRLDIRLIAARSPQAKGRVERLFQTLQDRLVKELRRAGAGHLVEANAVLWAYLPRFNKRFTQPPAQPGSAYRPQLSRAEANERIHFTYWRTVANDHTIAFLGHTLAIPPLPSRVSLAGRRVALHHRMDGRLAIAYQDQVIGLVQPAHLGPPRLEQFEPAEPDAALPTISHGLSAAASAPTTPVATETTPLRQSKPRPDHPWRRQGKRPSSAARANNELTRVTFSLTR